MYHLRGLNGSLLGNEEVAMITKEAFMDIVALHRQGHSIRFIAKKLGMHRNTVKKFIEAAASLRMSAASEASASWLRLYASSWTGSARTTTGQLGI